VALEVETRERIWTVLIFFSSNQYEYPADPECVLDDGADIMVSFADVDRGGGKAPDRHTQLLKHRRRRKREDRKRNSDRVDSVKE